MSGSTKEEDNSAGAAGPILSILKAALVVQQIGFFSTGLRRLGGFVAMTTLIEPSLPAESVSPVELASSS